MIGRLQRCARGTVMVETLIAFVPLLTLFLGIVQYCLLSAAQLIVAHAAVTGVRAASVVLDDDPASYDGAVRLLVSDGPRARAIEQVVYAKLAAIVPARAATTLKGEPGTTVLDGLGADPAERQRWAARYLPVTTAVVFPRAPGDAALHADRAPAKGPITVRVTHAVTCTVPLVNALMCSTLRDELAGRGSAADELRRAPKAAQQDALGEVRVKVLQGEASMPIQTAPYAYASEREDKS